MLALWSRSNLMKLFPFLVRFLQKLIVNLEYSTSASVHMTGY